MFQNFINGVFVQSYTHPAQHVGHFVVSTPQVLDVYVKPDLGSHSSVPDDIQIQCCKDVGERVIVGSDGEMAVL